MFDLGYHLAMSIIAFEVVRPIASARDAAESLVEAVAATADTSAAAASAELLSAAAAAPADTAAGAEKLAAALVAENPASRVALETPSPERSDSTSVCNGRATAAAAPAAVALAVAPVGTAAAALCVLFRFCTRCGIRLITLAVIRQGLWPQGVYSRCRFFRTSPS